MIIGSISLAIGAIGAVVPLLPSVPFLLLSAFCFSKSSEKLDTWFKNTNLYKNNLESYVKGQGMTKKSKIKIMVIVTILMSIGFIMMMKVPIGQIILFIVWVFHIIFFLTMKTKEEDVDCLPEEELIETPLLTEQETDTIDANIKEELDNENV